MQRRTPPEHMPHTAEAGPNTAGPSNAGDEMDWEPDPGEQPMPEERSSHRTPRVTLEEVEDEEARSPRRTPRVTLEE
ncbi:hypothetical protein FRC10_004819, partial [Ceratobasidium sp. 414]